MISCYYNIKRLIRVSVGSLDEDMLELKRQLVHLINGSAITAAVFVLKPVIGLLVLAPLLVALVLLFFAPRLWPDLRIANHLMYHFERRKDIVEFPFRGAIFYGLGIIAPIVLLDRNHGCAVILVLSVGDAFSNLVGRRYGRVRIGHRSIEGSAGFFVTSWAAASLLVSPSHAFVLAFTGAVIELFGVWDDNLSIPLGLSILAKFFL